MLGFVGCGTAASIASVSKVGIWLGANPLAMPNDEDATMPYLASTTRLLRVLQHDDSAVSPNQPNEGLAEIEEYEGLERAHNVSQLILTVLHDIRNWRHVVKGEQTVKQNFQRHAILERQRDVLLQKQQDEAEEELNTMVSDDAMEADACTAESQEDEEGVVGDDAVSAEETDDGDIEEDIKEAEDDDDDDNTTCDPWQRTLRTFHSLQVLTPILIKMLRHPRRNDVDIQIGKTNIIPTENTRKKRRGGGRPDEPSVWLFGTRVYDVCKKQQAERLWVRLVELYIFFGLSRTDFDGQDSDALIRICQERLEQTLAQARDLNDAETQLGSECPLPFDGMEQAEVMYKHSKDLDDKYELTKPLTDAEQYQLYQTSTKNLHAHIESILKRRFPKCRLSIYGSCLSDLSLGKAADVDLSLCIPEMEDAKQKFEAGQMPAKAYQNSVKKKVFMVCNLLERNANDFTNMQPVHRARVPVIKGTYASAENPFSLGGALDFDICFLNDIAVANSGLLREYSLVDPRIKSLMIAVKRWAKANGLSSAQDNFLSSYTWMNLVVYYVLRLGLAPNLQSKDLAKAVGLERDKDNGWHCVNNLDTFFLKWDEVSSVWDSPERLANLSVSSLLYGFFRFYSMDFPVTISTVSIKRVGEPFAKWNGFHRLSMFLSIEDPFEAYDSHMPHDLGIHAGESGSIVIMERFRQAREYLYQILVGGQSDKELLWPVVSVPSDAISRAGGPKEGGKRARKKNQQKGAAKNHPVEVVAKKAQSKRANPRAAAEPDRGLEQTPLANNTTGRKNAKRNGAKVKQGSGASQNNANSAKASASSNTDINGEAEAVPIGNQKRKNGRRGGKAKQGNTTSQNDSAKTNHGINGEAETAQKKNGRRRAGKVKQGNATSQNIRDVHAGQPGKHVNNGGAESITLEKADTNHPGQNPMQKASDIPDPVDSSQSKPNNRNRRRNRGKNGGKASTEDRVSTVSAPPARSIANA